MPRISPALQRQRDVVDRQPAGRARQANLLGAKHLLARLVVVGLGEILGVGADHLAHDPLRVDVLHLLLAGDVAVAQHGDVVADADQLLQPVRDVDDRDALRLEVGDHLEQHLDLGRAKRRGRLVHDQDRGVERHRLGDLDQLLLADPQVLHQHVGPDAGLQPIQELARRAAPAPCGRCESRLVISRVAKMFSATDRLPNRLSSWNTMPMPRAHGIAGRGEGHLLAVQQDPALRRLLDAGDDLHQRRLAGAVLADQHVDRAARAPRNWRASPRRCRNRPSTCPRASG